MGEVMKSILSLAILASGLGSAGALADSPLTDAFSDYLGSCWANHQEGQPAPEIYCFERLENDFVRIVRENPGPHGMFLNEQHLSWDAEAEVIRSTMYTMMGGVIDSDGIIEDGHATLFQYHDETGELQLKFNWGPVIGESGSMIREQFLGEDYGGWNTEAERVFTREPAITRRRLAYAMWGNSGHGRAIFYFEHLLDSCWSAPLDGTEAVDTHCFSDLLGVFVRDRHIVEGNPDYSGEMLLHYDEESEQLRFRYVNSIGGVSRGFATMWNREIKFEEETYIAPDGEEQTFRGRYYDVSNRGYSSITEQRVGDAWVVVSQQHFTRVPGRAWGPGAE